MAGRLDTDVTAEHGPEHLDTVHVREVRAHLAYLAGDHATSLGWYLHTARLRATIQGPGHPDTEEATRRVYSLWRAFPDADAAALGTELLGRSPTSTAPRRQWPTAPAGDFRRWSRRVKWGQSRVRSAAVRSEGVRSGASPDLTTLVSTRTAPSTGDAGSRGDRCHDPISHDA